MKADNIIKGKRVPVMHGEMWFDPIDSMPKGKTVSCKLYIAGHSETGHHHVLEAKSEFEVLEPKDKKLDRAVLLKEVTKLFHQKTFDVHETKYLAPGAYKIYKKTEYDPFQEIVREIWD